MSTIATTNIKHASSSSNNIVLGSDGSAYMPGHIIQVVQTIKTDTFSTTSSSNVDITGLSVAITPSSTSSKILVAVNLGIVSGVANSYPGFILLRGSTAIGVGTSATGDRVNVSFGNFGFDGPSSMGLQGSSASFQYLDSPSTTSSTTYKVQVYSAYNSHQIEINRSNHDADNPWGMRSASTIIAMEVAA